MLLAVATTEPRYMAIDEPLVQVVDDDEAMRLSIVELLGSVGIQAASFASGRDLMTAERSDRPGCVILDVRMPGGSGLQIQSQLANAGIRKPIIFMTAHGDVPMTIQAMKAGAIDFLTKPLRQQELLDAVHAGVEADRRLRAEGASAEGRAELYKGLSRRERQLFAAIAQGKLNKQIAYDLGISEVTVKLHRGNMMRKMEAGSIADLVRMWDGLPENVRAAAGS